MAILRTCTALACVAVAASARQLPLVADDSYPSYNPVPSSPSVVGNGTAIDTKKLQSDIDIKKLVARAEELSKIADLSLPEYNHPTRVIGSKGETTSLKLPSTDVDYLRTPWNRRLHLLRTGQIGRLLQRHEPDFPGC
jgi:aminopeptidase Y